MKLVKDWWALPLGAFTIISSVLMLTGIVIAALLLLAVETLF